MTELALETFCALPCSEVLAHNGLGVNTCTTVICQFVHSFIRSVSQSVSRSCMHNLCLPLKMVTYACTVQSQPAQVTMYVCRELRCCKADRFLMMLLCYRFADPNTHVYLQKKKQHAEVAMEAGHEKPVSETSTEESVLTRRDLRLLDCNGKQVIELLLSICLGFLLVLWEVIVEATIASKTDTWLNA